MRVAINAQLVPESAAGGVVSVVIGLISALGTLEGTDEYVVIGLRAHESWLEPYLGANQRLVPGAPARHERVKSLLGPLRPVARNLRRRVGRIVGHGAGPWVPASDGYYERLGCDVLHFPYQDFVVSRVPSIYNPHDLQHLHHPHFFTRDVLAWRAAVYPAACRAAHTVVVASSWVKNDVVTQFGLPAEKVQVIPFAPPTQVYPEPSPETLQRVRRVHRLSEPFAFYPSVTWPHKNHLRMLDAVALLRDRHRLQVRLVCAGHQNEFWPTLRRRIRDLRLEDQVTFVGFVPPEDLRALYRLSQFVVVPTLFEAASGPLIEAWQDDIPVACSNVTSLPEQAGDAALIFDPFSVEAIAAAMGEMATNPSLRASLRRRGARRLLDFSWDRTARAYRAVYRRAAGHPLTEEDRHLLRWDWMRQPKPEPAVVQEVP